MRGLPGQGLVNGDWDFLPNSEANLGNTDLRGGGFRDAGTAGGSLPVHMKKQGAGVIGCGVVRGFTIAIAPSRYGQLFGGRSSTNLGQGFVACLSRGSEAIVATVASK